MLYSCVDKPTNEKVSLICVFEQVIYILNFCLQLFSTDTETPSCLIKFQKCKQNVHVFF